jgi:hypothetical protein
VFEKRREAISTIILAGAGCESFINELGAICADPKEHTLTPADGRVRDLGRTLLLLEEAHASLNLKFRATAQILYQTQPDLGASPFQDFIALVGVRNELMHVKDVSVVNLEGPLPATEIPMYSNRLLQRRKMTEFKHARNYHWMQRLQRRWIADWAYRSAAVVCKYILDGVPPIDAVRHFRGELRELPPS